MSRHEVINNFNTEGSKKALKQYDSFLSLEFHKRLDTTAIDLFEWKKFYLLERPLIRLFPDFGIGFIRCSHPLRPLISVGMFGDRNVSSHLYGLKS